MQLGHCCRCGTSLSASSSSSSSSVGGSSSGSAGSSGSSSSSSVLISTGPGGGEPCCIAVPRRMKVTIVGLKHTKYSSFGSPILNFDYTGEWVFKWRTDACAGHGLIGGARGVWYGIPTLRNLTGGIGNWFPNPGEARGAFPIQSNCDVPDNTNGYAFQLLLQVSEAGCSWFFGSALVTKTPTGSTRVFMTRDFDASHCLAPVGVDASDVWNVAAAPLATGAQPIYRIPESSVVWEPAP
jgi:hypothetical protein